MILTKLHKPLVGSNVVQRANLFEKLNQGLNKKLILISATAGYGKTTLVSDWVDRNKIAAAWCSLDARDNDPFEFLRLIITSINKQVESIGKNSLDLLNAPGTVNIQYIIELFINDLLGLESDLILVLDDVHLINNKQVMDIISAIIEYKPNHLKLLISTRSDPILAFSRLRSQNDIIEIRSKDLSFSKRDIGLLLNKKLNLGLTENDLNLLEQKTEGWIAGLQLTALAVQNHDNASQYIEKLAGDNRYIMDYLLEEILNTQDEEMVQFLLYTSILEHLSGTLCDLVLKKSNSQALLETLEKDNIFLIPLDNERSWYRYHHLFGDLLKHKLETRYKEEIPDLHNSASIWFESNGEIVPAIEHAIKGGSKERAINLISGIIDKLWTTSHYAIILKFEGILTEDVLLSNNNIGVIYAWVISVFGRLTEAESLLNKILKTNPNSKLLGRVYETFNFIKVLIGDTEAAFKYSELAIKSISEDDVVWNAWAHVSHGESHLLRMELDDCVKSFEKANSYASMVNSFYLRLISESKTAYIHRIKGKYTNATKICNNLIEEFSSHDQDSQLRTKILTSVLYSTKGFMLTDQNQVEEGITLAKQGYEYSRNLISVAFKTYIAVVLAETYYKAGLYKESVKILDEIDSNLKSKAVKWINLIAYAIKIKLLILEGEDEKLEKEIRLDIPSGKNFAFERCFLNITILRYYLYKGKYDEVISLSNEMCAEFKNQEVYEILSEVELIRARTFLKKNKLKEAIESVIKAIQITQNEKLIRTFIVEGDDIYKLLKEIKQLKNIKSNELLDSVSKDFLNKLLEVFEKEIQQKLHGDDVLLSSRELDTLKQIAKDLSNQEIADELFISITTVKTHVRNILLKLEAKNRREAVSIAKEKGII